MQLPDHAIRHLRTLAPGDELDVIEPVVPQPSPEFRESGECYEYHPTCLDDDGYEYPGSKVYGIANDEEWFVCRHRPGDVVVVVSGDCWIDFLARGECLRGTECCTARHDEHHLRLLAVDCKPVRELTPAEWTRTGITAGGFDVSMSSQGRDWWNATHTHRGPEYAWGRAWTWVETWELIETGGT